MGRTYTIDLDALQQVNEDTGTTRPVQRKTNAPMTGANQGELPSPLIGWLLPILKVSLISYFYGN